MAETETETESQIQPTDDSVALSEAMPAPEAFAHAIAAAAHQAAAATPEDAPVAPGRLPFPRPPVDVEKHLGRIFAKRAEIRELALEALRADETAKRASKAQKAAHEAVNTAHSELDELIDLLEEDRRAEGDGPMEQLTLHEAGRTPCAWEREHPGEMCGICSSGGSHNGDHAEGSEISAAEEGVSGGTVASSIPDEDDREEPDDDELKDEQEDDDEEYS